MSLEQEVELIRQFPIFAGIQPAMQKLLCFSAERLKSYRESFHELKGNRHVCATTVGLPQNILLAERSDMDHVIEAIRKIQTHSAALAKAAG